VFDAVTKRHEAVTLLLLAKMAVKLFMVEVSIEKRKQPEIITKSSCFSGAEGGI
jgi:hypothetical protein